MIKRGVSLYSFQEELFLGKMTIEDCFAFSKSIGATGIEVLPEQNMRGFPNISDTRIAWWKDTAMKYGQELTCYDMFLDTKKYPGREMSEEEQVASIRRDLDLCCRLGIRNMRILVFVRPDILEKCVPYAEDLDIHMGVEVHAPWHIEHAWILRTVEVADRLGTKHLGLLPDMGIFVRSYPPEWRDRFLRDGATPEIVQFIVKSHAQRIMAEYTIYEVAAKMRGNAVDIRMAETLRHNPYSNPKRIAEYIPYFRHIQAKFFGVAENGTDVSIAYDEVIPELIEGGWSGYLSSEYEGNRWVQDAFEVDSREQVSRQHRMFGGLLAIHQETVRV